MPLWVVRGVLIALLGWAVGGRAQGAGAEPTITVAPIQPGDNSRPLPGTATPLAPNTDRATNAPPPAGLSAGVMEIVRMADAGVSGEVLRAYVECSPTPCQPNDGDIIALKQHKVPDEVLTAMLKRGARTRAPGTPGRVDAGTRFSPAVNVRPAGLDPEGYEYFQRYYLYPRTLESVYQRVPPYYGGFPWSCGYPAAMGMRPYYPRAYGYSPYPAYHGGWP